MRFVYCVLIVMFLGGNIIIACEGDCTVCHQSIIKDGVFTKGHEGLGACKTCHTSESLENIDMGTASCGQDCWECHSMQKVANLGVKEHEILATCQECHKNTTPQIQNLFQNQMGTLSEFLKQ